MEKAKKEWVKPEVEIFGDVATLTQTDKGPGDADGGITYQGQGTSVIG